MTASLARVSPSDSEPRRRPRIWMEVPEDVADQLKAAQRQDGVSPARRMRALAIVWAADEGLQEQVTEELLKEQARRASSL